MVQHTGFCYIFFKGTWTLSKIISLVIFVCLAMWSIRNLKVHDVSCASATLRLVIIATVSKGLLYSTGGPAEPYIDGVSQQLKRRLESHGIRTVFRSDTTLRQQLTCPKDPIPPHRRDGIVYNIPCQGCDRS